VKQFRKREEIIISNYFYVPGKLPGMNEIVRAARSGWQVAAKQKRDVEQLIRSYIWKSRLQKQCYPIDGQAIIIIIWNVKNKRMDVDNIQAANKFILDAMKGELIIDDSRKYISQVLGIIQNGQEDGVEVHLAKPEDVNITFNDIRYSLLI
jgi:Holliday junction resolvase RusA-like endonuclease